MGYQTYAASGSGPMRSDPKAKVCSWLLQPIKAQLIKAQLKEQYGSMYNMQQPHACH